MRNKNKSDFGIDIFDGMDNADLTTFQNTRRWLGMRILVLATIGATGGSVTGVYALYEKSSEVSNDVSNYIVRHSDNPSSSPAPQPETPSPTEQTPTTP